MYSGCYYLPPEVCKRIISSGVTGMDFPITVKILVNKITSEITIEENIIDLMPFLKMIDRDILRLYSRELTLSLLTAVFTDKGVEIVIGYPKILVINVN